MDPRSTMPTFAARGSPEWDAAWAALAAAIQTRGLGDGSDLEQANEAYGEVWQYMGRDGDGRQCFRHRAHPSNDERIHIRVNA
ncbi:MAG: hypothetical protein HYT80_00515 [Euryarchaeota archaeon]|nr:hypothetical protein [Euryarchaeota archaeon]